MDETSKIKDLLKQVEKLERENALLRRDFSSQAKGNTVSFPESMKTIFEAAQKNVAEYFSKLKIDPSCGTVEIGDQRYLFIRASALSIDFFTTIRKLYADREEKEALSIAKNFLFDLSHAIGMSDAKNFHTHLNLTDPLAKLSAGPVHFAYSGWAYVDILPESNPSPDENYFLIYRHPFSFEADSWIRAGKKSDMPVCIMNSGYSSGWCEESFGMPLTAVEVTCKARGDEHCTFIMSPPDKIETHVMRYASVFEKQTSKKINFEIPTFFERKKVEEIINQKSNELAHSNQELEQFAYVVSHDLQEPLRTISNFVGLLNEKYFGKTDPDTEQYYNFITTATSKMQNLLKDLLEFSRVGRNITFSLVDCNEILNDVIADMAALIKENNAKITSVPLPRVKGNEMELKQLFQNLISNGIKFRKKDVKPEITITTEENENEIIFAFKDNGIGIEEQYFKKLFIIFQRLQNATEFPGTGIGLATCKKIVTLHNGKIWLESKLGEGSTFYFTIPKEQIK